MQCDFVYARFRFHTDGPIDAARVAEGNIALVLDNGGMSRGTDGEGRPPDNCLQDK